MGGNSFGTVFRVTTWGESHGPGVGAVVDGCPAGLPLSAEVIQRQLDRRRPGQSALTSPRREPDLVEILSGVYKGRATGTPIALLVRNRDANSSQYSALERVYRPGHADFTYAAKYGIRDFRGGGRASARETVGRVAAGAVALQLLWSSGIDVLAFTAQVGPVAGDVVDREEIDRNPVRAADPDAAPLMAREIDRARAGGDSVGGIVEARAIGVPAGLGEPVFDKLDADIAKAMMSIGAVKGVEIGAGFALARMAGSEANDPFEMVGGRVRTATNNAGGILGGISNGEEIVVRLAVKPTSSIRQEQRTVTEDGQETTIEIHGRHDPCICPRIVPVAEAMLALVLADHLLRHRTSRA